ncbi:MAG: DUF6088 family protein [Clostridia bacterium]
MARLNYLKEIEKRIVESAPGSVFITSDFLDVAQTSAINQALRRLSQDQVILRRIMRGIYEHPEYSEFLQEIVAPDPNLVAAALARNYGWTIAPCGNTALNRLGLSTQVPSVWSYASDGPYKTYELFGMTLKFKHTTRKEITGISEKSAVVVQALKKLGQASEEVAIVKLRQSLSAAEKRRLLSETRYVTAWIFEAIKQICKGNDRND